MKMESMYEQLGVSAAVYEYGERIIAELRQLKYGEMRIVMRNGVPVQLESTRSEKLEEK